ncbi:alanine--tRNA ligase, partial [Patescibacteria group bacterium]|nr:alanine--tRNA ligase [Patescibacteria group bacterium]
MTSQELRKKFLDFFEKNNHAIIPSASLIPSGEEQLEGKEKVLFTSAGMQPLIPYLLGKSHPEGKRLANVQKCLRTDDIDQVGDAVHHTFFEMLGNWSLGDYWKDEAIRLSFEFLTKELEIPIEKLAVSVFAGDKDAPRDEESAKTWKGLGIPEDRIFYFGKDHNWWPTGEKSGLCGPDTEMFYWISEGKPEGKPNEDPRWVEFWNDVFIQFNRKEDGTLEDLPQKNVDTGMGLERILAVLNGKDSDYETDLFEPIIAEIRKSKNNYSKRS